MSLDPGFHRTRAKRLAGPVIAGPPERDGGRSVSGV